MTLETDPLTESTPNQPVLTAVVAEGQGSGYRFAYDPFTGELTSMLLPSGVEVRYAYATYSTTRDQTETIGREVVSREITCHGQTASWRFWRVRESPTRGVGGFTIVRDPIGLQTKYTFLCPIKFPWAAGLLQTKETYDGAPFDEMGTVVDKARLLQIHRFLFTVQPTCFGDLVLYLGVFPLYDAANDVRRSLYVSPKVPVGRPTERDLRILEDPQVKADVQRMHRKILSGEMIDDRQELGLVVKEVDPGDHDSSGLIPGMKPFAVDLDLGPDDVATIHSHPFEEERDVPHKYIYGGSSPALEHGPSDTSVCRERKIVCYVLGRTYISRFDYRSDDGPVRILSGKSFQDYIKSPPRACPLSSTVSITSVRAMPDRAAPPPSRSSHVEVLEERLF